MRTIATAQAKFILSGEHFVVEGAPSVVIPASCFTTQVQIVDKPEPGLTVSCSFDCEQPDLDRNRAEYESLVMRLVQMAADMLDISLQGGGYKISVMSHIPPGQGAGSSSALCQAIVEVLIKHFIIQECHPNYYQWFGNELENRWHGPVSGIDNAAVAWRRMIAYQRNKPLSFLSPGGPMFFVVGSVGMRKGTSPYQTFQWVRENQPLQFAAYRKVMEDNATSLSRAICQGNLSVMGKLMNESHQLFDAVGIVDAKANRAVKEALGCGALGARMTGAGGGGFVIALVSVQHAEKLQLLWEKMGLSNIRLLHFGV